MLCSRTQTQATSGIGTPDAGFTSPAGQLLHTIQTSGHVPDALDWNPRHLVLAWPNAFSADYRDASRDSGPVAIFAATGKRIRSLPIGKQLEA